MHHSYARLSWSTYNKLSSLSLFFFSSRRRHTRCLSDWSSDVCSSDLCWPEAPVTTSPYCFMLPSHAADEERPQSLLAVSHSLDEVFDVWPHARSEERRRGE